MAPALDFLLTYDDLIFPGAPIVFCGLDRVQLGSRALPSNVYGVLVKREFAPTLEVALSLHPATKRFVVVAGASEFDKGLLAQARDQFRPYENRVSISYLSELPLDQILARVSQLPPDEIVLFLSLFSRRRRPTLCIPHEVVERISGAASVPVYGFVDQYLGRGITGGSLYSFTAHGSDTARMVLPLLTGVAPPQKLSESFSNRIIFDWRQMTRWDISESRLPPNSEISFREKSVWAQYSWQILFVLAVVLVQAGLISILLHERSPASAGRSGLAPAYGGTGPYQPFLDGRRADCLDRSRNQSTARDRILTNAETAQAILTSPSPDMEELNHIVSDILQDDRRASEVIRRMRSLLKKLPSSPGSWISTICCGKPPTFLRRWRSDGKFELICLPSPDALAIVGDRIQLQQVILNLVVNAIDAMADTAGRRPHCKPADCADRRPRRTFGTRTMDEAFRRTECGTFSSRSSPPRRKGWEWGFPIARTIVEAHDGQISAVNRPGGGAVSRIKLPIARHAECWRPAVARLTWCDARPRIPVCPGGIVHAFLRCYATISINRADRTRNLARRRTGIRAVLAGRALFRQTRPVSASAIQYTRFAGSRCASFLQSAARELSSSGSTICAPCPSVNSPDKLTTAASPQLLP